MSKASEFLCIISEQVSRNVLFDHPEIWLRHDQWFGPSGIEGDYVIGVKGKGEVWRVPDTEMDDEKALKKVRSMFTVVDGKLQLNK